MIGGSGVLAKRPRRVLYVEDNPQDADLTVRYLQKLASHIQIQVVVSQKKALELLYERQQPCDLVLIDRNLADGDGLSLLVKLRSLNLPVAIVMVTGSGDEETVIAALKAGADDYIIKRDDYLDRLPAVMEAALQHYHQQVSRYNRPLRVLYAEHHPADIDLTRRYLEKNAPYITLEVVNTAQQVLEVLTDAERLNRVDVLLVDYRLPGGLNALELIKEIREVRRLATPIVLVTGQGDEMIALQALRLGAQDYIPKTEHYLARLPYALADAYHRARLEQEHDALRSSEERFRSLFMDSPVAMLEQNFAEVKHRLLALKRSGVMDVRNFLLQHPEIVRDLMDQSVIVAYNRAALRLYGVEEENPPRSLGKLLDFEAVWQDFTI
jgi:DNA-binding NtrC family response regulator